MQFSLALQYRQRGPPTKPCKKRNPAQPSRNLAASLLCALGLTLTAASTTQAYEVVSNASGLAVSISHGGKIDPFLDGASVIDKRDPYTDGALTIRDDRDPFTESA